MEAVATVRDLQYLRHAIALAAAAKARGKHPFAALIVDDRDTVLAEAGNAFGWPDGDATGHAELIAVREASRRFPPARLAQATLYSSAEPCAMCAGAIAAFRIKKLVFGAYDPKSGGVEHGPRVFAHATTHHKPEIIGGVRDSECSALLAAFFAGLRHA